MRLAVFHYPIEGWTDAVVLNVLQGLAAAVTLDEMAAVSYAPLADVVRAIAPREKRHTDLGLAGLTDLAATEEGRVESSAAIAYWQPKVADSFGAANSARFETLKRFGLRHRPNEALLADWTASVRTALAPLGLA
jgi:1,2-phenylacetyl-CoA epoxidase catalytic subunit